MSDQITFDKKAPCKECPFRRDSARGWLGEWSPMSLLKTVHDQVPFACHMETEADWDEVDEWGPYNHCAGALAYQKANCILPRDKEHAEAVRAQTPDESQLLLSREAFTEHHTR